MDEKIRDALNKPFGPEAIRTKRGQGGREMQYVSHGMCTKRLNDVAPDWTAEMIERWITETNGALHCLGGIMRMTIAGVTREEAGGPTRLTTLADDLKNTYSDCLKRCAMRFGVALDMWESADENDEDAQAPPHTNTSAPPRRAPSPQPPPTPPQRGAVAPVAAPTPHTADQGNQRATERQVKFIIAIAREAGLDELELDQWSQELYAQSVDQLNRRDASTLIEALQRRRNEVA